METIIYIAFFVLFMLNGYFMYSHIKLKNVLKKQDIDHRKALVEAGNAITDTLKIVFENLKKNSSDHIKINTKLTEHSSKVHRLEQHINRKNQQIESSPEYIDEDIKISRKKEKEQSVK